MKPQLETIWQRIEQEKIKPLPRWVLLSRQTGIWLGFVLSVTFGALTLSYLVFIMENMNLDVLLITAPLEIISFAPLVWGIAFILFLFLAFWSVEHTESGYKVHFSLWILGNIALTSVLALLLVAFEVPRSFEASINNLLPPISATSIEQHLWHRPETGRIQGEIIEIDNKQLLIQNPMGEDWIVLIVPETRKPGSLQVSTHIRVLGEQIGNRQLKASQIVPVPRPFKKPPHRGMREIQGLIP